MAGLLCVAQPCFPLHGPVNGDLLAAVERAQRLQPKEHMLEYNLTQRERDIMVRLLELSQHSKEQFEVHIIDPAATGPGRELARLDFGGENHSMEVTKRDLRVLKDEGLIHFHWKLPERGIGRLSSLAFEAVGSSFAATTESVDAAASAAAAAHASLIADEAAIALRFQRITRQLVSLAGQLIDAKEAAAAANDAASITEEMAKDVPDEAIITRNIKGFVSRLSLTFSSTSDLAKKGDMIGEFGERLAAWLVALSVWTEWHANRGTCGLTTR